MKRLLVVFLSLYALNTNAQSVLISPQKILNSSPYNHLIIGADTILPTNYKLFIHNKTQGVNPSISILNNTQNPLQASLGLHNSNQFFGMILGLSSNFLPSLKPTFSIQMPQGNVNFSNTGNLQLGLNNNDTSKVNLSIRNNAAKVAFTNSGTAIGLSQEIHSVITEAKLSEVHGLYSYADSANYVNNSILTETGTSGLVANIGVFGNINNPPKYSTAHSIAIFGQDNIDFSNTFAGYFKGKVKVQGNLDVLGTLSKSAGAFKIDHPLDPYNKILMHSFVESPEMINIYNGMTTTGSDSLSSISLPDYFEALNKDPRYQLTAIGQFSQAIVIETINDNSFTIKTDKPNVNVSWQVIGTRKDVFAVENPITPVINKSGSEVGNLLYQPQFVGGTLINNTEQKSQNNDYKGTVKFN